MKVAATREAVFGDEGVQVNKMQPPSGKGGVGVLTGRTLVGFAEAEMDSLDGKKHWYPIDQLETEDGKKLVEEEIAIEEPEDDGDASEEEE